MSEKPPARSPRATAPIGSPAYAPTPLVVGADARGRLHLLNEPPPFPNDVDIRRENLDWLSRATNWAKFSATAGLGVIHRGHLSQGRALMEPYLPRGNAPSVSAADLPPSGRPPDPLWTPSGPQRSQRW
eukprot:7194869-Pyramimonas_sp.AAC.1